MSDLENQIAKNAEVQGQMSLFEDWTPEYDPADDYYEPTDEELAEALRDALLPDRGMADPTAQEIPLFRAAYIVLIDQAGNVGVATNLDQAFNVERTATDEDIRRTSRDVNDFYQAAYVADWAAGAIGAVVKDSIDKALNQPPAVNPIAKKAFERGLIGP